MSIMNVISLYNVFSLYRTRFLHTNALVTFPNFGFKFQTHYEVSNTLLTFPNFIFKFRRSSRKVRSVFVYRKHIVRGVFVQKTHLFSSVLTWRQHKHTPDFPEFQLQVSSLSFAARSSSTPRARLSERESV